MGALKKAHEEQIQEFVKKDTKDKLEMSVKHKRGTDPGNREEKENTASRLQQKTRTESNEISKTSMRRQTCWHVYNRCRQHTANSLNHIDNK